MDVSAHVPMAGRTTLKLGGEARWFVEPADRGEVCEAISWAGKNSLPVTILGRGSNVVMSDRGWPGLVVYLSTRFSSLVWQGDVAVCSGGLALHALVKESVKKGLQGVECLGWIPGTVGGAAVMNAGAFGQSMSDVVASAECVDSATGLAFKLSALQLQFGYRKSILRNGKLVVLSVLCQLKNTGNPDELERRFKEIYERRRAKQPLDIPNCGSVFKNPPNQSAGAIIEQAGLPGTAVGGVEVSRKHANFFINTGAGTAEDFRRLFNHVRRTIYDRFTVLLEPEVVFTGDFDSPLYTPL